ncbi:hypothetical protein M0R04_03855 [Candidatus Dojkabacteria bacterium]|jgi:hypothetical protein|nr:hypothetical protein [Candidatus Dojkabacteria bacterium]
MNGENLNITPNERDDATDLFISEIFYEIAENPRSFTNLFVYPYELTLLQIDQEEENKNFRDFNVIDLVKEIVLRNSPEFDEQKLEDVVPNYLRNIVYHTHINHFPSMISEAIGILKEEQLAPDIMAEAILSIIILPYTRDFMYAPAQDCKTAMREEIWKQYLIAEKRKIRE